MNKSRFLIVATTFLLSCQPKKIEQDPKRAQVLLSEGMGILYTRIDIQDEDRSKAARLNDSAILKFSQSYRTDTTLFDAAFYASECTMFKRDYHSCLEWTTKVLALDTTQKNREFCNERIAHCKSQLNGLH